MRISDWSSDVCSSDLFVDANTPPSRDVGSLPVASARPARTRSSLGPTVNDAAAFPRPRDCVDRRSEERRVGKELSVRVDLGGRRIIKKKKTNEILSKYLYMKKYICIHKKQT